MIRDLFVPFHLAYELEGLGFNQPCLGIYDGDQGFLHAELPYRANSPTYTLAPLYHQAIDWILNELDEKHIQFFCIEIFKDGSGTWRDVMGDLEEGSFGDLQEAVRIGIALMKKHKEICGEIKFKE